MAYFTSYYTNYFDVGAAVAAEAARTYGSYSPTKEEWERYLEKWNELRRQNLALRATEFGGLRAMLRDEMFPRPPEKPKAAARKTVPQKVQSELRPEPRPEPIRFNPDIETRLRIAELLYDVRRRTKVLRAKKRKKRRDEDAIIALLH